MNKLLKNINNSLINLPSPSNIYYWWNYGSLLGMFLMIQLISGILLSMHYCPNTTTAFNSIIHIIQNVNQGWIIRNSHINGASMFFICMYTHIARGLYFHSFNLKYTWLMGITIFLTSMTIAFLGYVLPWGQMSFWGATVITNLVTTVPYAGTHLIEWLWGGFAINNATLNRFFSFHFILPFILMNMIILHLMFLHETGSNNPLGTNSNMNKIPFHPYFSIKDIFGAMPILLFFMIMNFQYPYFFSDPDNFTQANPLVTPTHIQPEWYFLFAYAILRSIPNKMGGVLALISSVMILYIMPWSYKHQMKSNKFYPPTQIMFWTFTNNFLLLTFMGTQMIEYPFMTISQILSVSYFTFFIINESSLKLWDLIIMSSH